MIGRRILRSPPPHPRRMRPATALDLTKRLLILDRLSNGPIHSRWSPTFPHDGATATVLPVSDPELLPRGELYARGVTPWILRDRLRRGTWFEPVPGVIAEAGRRARPGRRCPAPGRAGRRPEPPERSAGLARPRAHRHHPRPHPVRRQDPSDRRDPLPPEPAVGTAHDARRATRRGASHLRRAGGCGRGLRKKPTGGRLSPGWCSAG